MGILKPGISCILIQGKNFGKKIIIDKISDNKVYYKDNDKIKHVGIYHVFPIL